MYICACVCVCVRMRVLVPTPQTAHGTVAKMGSLGAAHKCQSQKVSSSILMLGTANLPCHSAAACEACTLINAMHTLLA